jgi:hypothetical protein
VQKSVAARRSPAGEFGALPGDVVHRLPVTGVHAEGFSFHA